MKIIRYGDLAGVDHNGRESPNGVVRRIDIRSAEIGVRHLRNDIRDMVLLLEVAVTTKLNAGGRAEILF